MRKPANLMVVTEAQVEQNLSQMTNKRVVITHSLSTVRNADQIIVLAEGAIVESGSHDDLIALNGYCARLARG